ncbi:MAG: REP element-mobilizing transposase RayT [Planctomycetota bacterium]|jgi:REP element-mobilizing transposase RayT
MANGREFPTPSKYRIQGRLPHYDDQLIIQMITFCLADAYPSMSSKIDKSLRVTELDGHLHRGLGDCILNDPLNATIVERAFLHFHKARYQLHAWVVMPNHVHVLLTVFDDFPMWQVVRNWKSFSSKAINEIRGGSGVVWQPDYHDRYMRNEEHFQGALDYIENNPVAAELCNEANEWRFSSAWPDQGWRNAGGTPALPVPDPESS